MVVAASFLTCGNAFAAIVDWTFADTYSNFPGHEISPVDTIVSPSVGDTIVRFDDSDGRLLGVRISVANRLVWDTLLINTSMTGNASYDEWDLLVRDSSGKGYTGGNPPDPGTDPNIVTTGLYSVNDPANYNYTMATAGRKNHPNGIDNDDLTKTNDVVTGSYGIHPAADEVGITYRNQYLTYNFTKLLNPIMLDMSGSLGAPGFAIAYVPWCANDITITPVPEPATMLLFGAGIFGLAGIVRRRMK